MAQIVLIHGIGQQASTAEEQEAAWLPSLVKGVMASEHPNAAAVAARVAASTGQNHPPLPPSFTGIDDTRGVKCLK